MLLWNYSLSEIVKGYTEEETAFSCIICKKKFERGRIYSINDELYDAFGAIQQHEKLEHKSTANYLLEQELSLTGITENQKKILRLVLKKKSDQEIAKELKISPSTVRNYRFKLREKERQAKLFLALMGSLEQETKKKTEPPVKPAKKERPSVMTDEEQKKILNTYFKSNGTLKQFPAKEKKKLVVLQEIVKYFTPDTIYSEQEVNRILYNIYNYDVVTIRRALIEYKFMERTADGSVYQVKK